MRRSILATSLLTMTVCMTQAWGQDAQPGTPQPAAPQPAPAVVPLTPTTTPSLIVAPGTENLPLVNVPSPPTPPGLPVPQQPPVVRVLPPLEVDLTQPITLDQAMQVAFSRNPDIRIAVDQAARAVGVVNEARANFNPRFNATGTYTRQPEQTASFPAMGPNQPAETFTIQNPATTNLAVNGVLPLDISNRLAYATDISRYQFDIQYLNLVAVSERVILNVKTAYYDLLRACGQARTAQASVESAGVLLENTRARFEVGVVPRFDVTTAEVDLANRNQILIQTQTRVAIAQSVLNRTLGVAVNTPTQVLDITPPVDIAQVDVESSINAAHERRPEVRAARTAIALNQRNVKLQRTGLLPSLQVGANAFYNVETTTFMSENVNWNAVLTLSVPIWDGGVTRARVQQARADVANAVDTLDQTRLEVGLDVRTAALNLEEASRRTQTTASAVVLAEEALRLANVRYDAGIATLVEVTNAESQLTQARFNFVNAQYDYAVALAQLQRATSTQPELNQLQLLGGSVPSI